MWALNDVMGFKIVFNSKTCDVLGAYFGVSTMTQPNNAVVLHRYRKGIQHVGGSMFSSIPKAEAIMIKDTLHNWSDENCIKILKNSYEALPEKGKVVVLDFVLPEAPETTMKSRYVSCLDNTMMKQPGGQERTVNEFRALSEAAGFTEFKVVCVASKLWVVMELHK